MHRSKPGAERLRQLSMKLPMADAEFLEEALGFKATALGLRAMISEVRSCGQYEQLRALGFKQKRPRRR